MRIIVSDYSGHPFQVQLSRELARRGHMVSHVYFAGFQTPKGNLERQPDDPAGFGIEAVTIDRPFRKASFFTRRRQEKQVGRKIAEIIDRVRPDVVISSNAPLDTQKILLGSARKVDAGFVFWLQDIYSRAIDDVLSNRFGFVGSLIGRRYRALEFGLLRESDRVVAITSDFREPLLRHGVRDEAISIIENWAPLDELSMVDRDNAWSRREMPSPGLRVVYSGTLGYKHNPDLLRQLADELPGVGIYVFSEGDAADALASRAAADGIDNLNLRPWVPFKELSSALSAADVLVAIIEPGAGTFSVPSKVLTYLTMGKPILASMPRENLAAKIIEGNGAGIVVAPADRDGWANAAKTLVESSALRESMGRKGREYAERTFDIVSLGNRFEAVVTDVKPL